jgi:hypothetical protein
MKKPTGSNGTRQARAQTEHTASQPPRGPSKQARILLVLTRGETLNRFEAERIGDHALNSTISTLRNRYSIPIAGSTERVPTRFGEPTVCKRYSLPEAHRERARALLTLWGVA